jgi:hypothetical protein
VRRLDAAKWDDDGCVKNLSANGESGNAGWRIDRDARYFSELVTRKIGVRL